MTVYTQLHRTVSATASCLPLWYFERFRFFDGLSPGQSCSLTARVHVVQLARRRPLDLRGAGDDVFIVRQGSIDVADVGNNGRLTPITVLRDGDVFGACDVGQPGRLGQTAETREDCELQVMTSQVFTRMVAASPALDVDLVRPVNGRMVSFRRNVEQIQRRSGDARLALLLLALARDHGLANDDGVYIPVALTYRDIGSLIALSEGGVRQTLRSWSLYGLLETRYGMLRLCDVAALQRVGEGGAAAPYRPRQRGALRAGDAPMTAGPATWRASAARRAPADRIPPPVLSPGSRRRGPV